MSIKSTSVNKKVTVKTRRAQEYFAASKPTCAPPVSTGEPKDVDFPPRNFPPLPPMQDRSIQTRKRPDLQEEIGVVDLFIT